MNAFTEEQFTVLRQRAEDFYKSIGEVYCPYLGEKVVFNAKGLEHLKFHKKYHARSKQDQYIRFRILHLAPEILKLSKTLQGKAQAKVFELNRSNHRNERILVDVTYYEFVAILENIRARIIVKRIVPGQVYFWSVIPFWKMNKVTGNRKLHKGNPEED